MPNANVAGDAIDTRRPRPTTAIMTPTQASSTLTSTPTSTLMGSRDLGNSQQVEATSLPPATSTISAPPVTHRDAAARLSGDASYPHARDTPVSPSHDPPRPRTSHDSDHPGRHSDGAPLERPDTRMSVLSDEGYVASPPASPPLPPVQRAETKGSCKPYSAFNARTKWVIAALGGVAAVFSPISVSLPSSCA